MIKLYYKPLSYWRYFSEVVTFRSFLSPSAASLLIAHKSSVQMKVAFECKSEHSSGYLWSNSFGEKVCLKRVSLMTLRKKNPFWSFPFMIWLNESTDFLSTLSLLASCIYLTFSPDSMNGWRCNTWRENLPAGHVTSRQIHSAFKSHKRGYVIRPDILALKICNVFQNVFDIVKMTNELRQWLFV